jgi:hypothetical protein
LSLKTRFLAAAASLTLFGGTAAAGALTEGTADAATPSCGTGCVDVFSHMLGTHRSPNFVLDVKQGREAAGTPIILWRTSNADPAEDFTGEFDGLVSDFYTAGLVSSALNLHYGSGSIGHGGINQPAGEIEYSPYGVASGLCVGLASTAVSGEGVTLQPCGVSSKTVWVVDEYDQSLLLTRGYVPLINGSDTNFSHPFVLQYPAGGYPTDTPRPQLIVKNLTGFSNGLGPIVGTVPDYQIWGADFGVLR